MKAQGGAMQQGIQGATSRTRSILRYAWNVVFWILVSVLLFFTVLLVFSSFDIGMHAYVISSGSMAPAIDTASLVFVRGSSEYEVGDIITFKNPAGQYTTHRIAEIRHDGTRTTFITQGDANEDPDMEPVELSDIKGRVLFHLPWIGHAISFFKTPPGLVIFVTVFAALLIEAFWKDIDKLAGKIKGSRHKAGARKDE